jgi:hypothetical protein
MVLATGLAVLPVALEDTDPKCDGSKKNGDLCREKKPKHNA